VDSFRREALDDFQRGAQRAAFQNDGRVDGTRSRDLRRDRRKTLGGLINELLRLFNKFRRRAPTRGDTKRPV